MMRLTRVRLTPETPRELSRQLREGSGRYLPRRRAAVALSLVAAGAMGVIGLYQMGIIAHLPEPPLALFDADRIDASPEAFSRFSTPDAVLAVGNYAATAALAAMGGADRAREAPWIPLALAAKVAFDVSQAVRLGVQQWTGFRAFCFWCLTAAAASLATVPVIVPETRAAARHLLGRDGA
jgi:uncharacterized membrane protein